MFVSSGLIFLKQKQEEDWQQMLAQGNLPQEKKKGGCGNNTTHLIRSWGGLEEITYGKP